MKTGNKKPFRDRRTSDRLRDSSLLIVSGKDVNSRLFTERTTVHDVSENGVSFRLKTLLKTTSILDLDICSTDDEGRVLSRFSIKGKVVRVTQTMQVDYHVAAEFIGEFAHQGKVFSIEAVAIELQRAVELDESRRSNLS